MSDQITPNRLIQIAQRIESAAQRYRDAAERMTKSNIAFVEAIGFPTLELHSLRRIESPIISLEKRLTDEEYSASIAHENMANVAENIDNFSTAVKGSKKSASQKESAKKKAQTKKRGTA